jgi:hypothetical protein
MGKLATKRFELNVMYALIQTNFMMSTHAFYVMKKPNHFQPRTTKTNAQGIGHPLNAHPDVDVF